ncbi:MAG: hypothetical protein ACFB15_07430 [Cyclobacteriaceae bacterium]
MISVLRRRYFAQKNKPTKAAQSAVAAMTIVTTTVVATTIVH